MSRERAQKTRRGGRVGLAMQLTLINLLDQLILAMDALGQATR